MQDWPRVHRAFWRALIHSIHPKVLWLTLWPLLVSSGALGLIWWQSGAWVLQSLRTLVAQLPGLSWLAHGLSLLGIHGVSDALAQAVVMLLCLSVAVVVALLVVSVLLTPALVSLVAHSRFPLLQSRYRTPWWAAAWWSLSSTFIAAGWWLLSMPLWLLPLGSALLPPLVWGWLTFRVLAHDVLAEHALEVERDQLLRQHRLPLLFMGVVSAYLGAAPAHLLMLAAWAAGAVGTLAAGSGVAALGALAAVAIPVALGGAIWIYTLVFAWSSLWFTHYLLEALAVSRQTQPAATTPSNLTWTPP
jgi:hypothetical protein